MNITPLEKDASTVLYEQVAERVAGLVDEGTLVPGKRIPSIRKLSQQLDVSISTVMEAYRLLEDRGLIEARPQSGYYVRESALQEMPEPQRTTPQTKARPVDVASQVYSMNQAIGRPEFVKLGAAVPGMEFLPLQALNRVMGKVLRDDPSLAHAYDGPPGNPQLRTAVARRAMDAGCSIAPDDLITTSGATEGVYLCLRAVTKPGDTVAIESPAYYGLLQTLESLHLNVLEIPTQPRDGIDEAALADAAQHGRIDACLLVSNFSNPLGSLMPDSKKKYIVEILARYDVPLIEDEIYGELYHAGTRPHAMKAYDREGLVLYCASASKIISPGLRVGWCAPGRYHSKVAQLKLVVTHSTATAAQLAVAAFFEGGGADRHLRRIRQAYKTQMQQMRQAICASFPADTRVTNPQGGHVLWVEMPDRVDADELFEQACDRRISIAPGPVFTVTNGYRNCIRLNSGIPWTPTVADAVAQIGELATKQLT